MLFTATLRQVSSTSETTGFVAASLACPVLTSSRQGIHLYIAQRKNMRGENKFCSVLSKGADVDVQMQEDTYAATIKVAHSSSFLLCLSSLPLGPCSPTGPKWVQVKLPSGPLLNGEWLVALRS
eukprot:765924-Hanusia_phi.AAC.2